MDLSIKPTGFVSLLFAALLTSGCSKPNSIETVVKKPGRQTAFSDDDKGSFSYLDLSQNQSSIYLVKGDQHIEVLSKADIVSQALSPNGRYLGVITLNSSKQCRIYLYDLKTADITDIAECSPSRKSPLAWSDDNTVFFVGQYGTQKAIQSFHPERKQATEYFRDNDISHAKPMKAPALFAYLNHTDKQSQLVIVGRDGTQSIAYQSSIPFDYCLVGENIAIVTQQTQNTEIKLIGADFKPLKETRLDAQIHDPYCSKEYLYFTQLVNDGQANIFRIPL